MAVECSGGRASSPKRQGLCRLAWWLRLSNRTVHDCADLAAGGVVVRLESTIRVARDDAPVIRRLNEGVEGVALRHVGEVWATGDVDRPTFRNHNDLG